MASFAALLFSEDSDQYCYETLYFIDFSVGAIRTPCSLPSGSAHVLVTFANSLDPDDLYGSKPFDTDSAPERYFFRKR